MAVAAATTLRRSILRAEPVAYTPSSVPAVGDIAADLRALSDALVWQPSPRSDPRGEHVALAPLEALFEIPPDVTIGILHVAAGQAYPEHRHPPQELYLVLAGRGRWMSNGLPGYRPQPGGSLVTNPPGGLHGVRAEDDAVTALYVLW